MCLVHTVRHIVAEHRLVGWDSHHIEFVDFPEFTSLGLGSTGHTSELVIHTEIVLQCDGCESLSSGFHIHTFLCLDSLVQTIAVAATFHNTAGLLIHNLHLAFLVNDIFIIAVEEGVSLQQLGYGVHTLCLERIVLEQLVALCHLLFVGERFVGHG